MQGVPLPFPYSSAITGSKRALRELHVQSGGHPLRVFYIFDPKREAVLLIGGDKTGNSPLLRNHGPACGKIWSEHLKETDQ